MAFTFVAKQDAALSASGGNYTVNFTVASGDTLVVVTGGFSGTLTTWVPSDGTNTYTTASAVGSVASTLTHRNAVYYALNPTPGSYTLTVTLGANRANRRVCVATYSGANAFQAAQSNGQVGAGTGTDAVTTTNMTPSSQPALLHGVSFTANGTATYTQGTGATSRGALSTWDTILSGNSMMEDIRLTSTSAVSSTWTIGTSRDTLSSGIIFTEVPVIALSGIASTEAFGTHTFSTPTTATISPSGIASTEAFGTATFTRTSVSTISPSGIASTEAFGTVTITHEHAITASGIASTEAFGTAAFSATGGSSSYSGVSSNNMNYGSGVSGSGVSLGTGVTKYFTD